MRAEQAIERAAEDLARLLTPTEIRGEVDSQLGHAVRRAREWRAGVAGQRTDAERRTGGDPDPTRLERDPVRELAAATQRTVDAVHELTAVTAGLLANLTGEGASTAKGATSRAEVAPCEVCWEAGRDTPAVKHCALRGVTVVPVRWCRSCFDLARQLGRMPSAEDLAASRLARGA